MKRWLFVPLLLLVCFFVTCPAFAEPGDLAAAHAQQLVAGDSGDAVTAVVTAVAPLLPAPWGALAPLMIPLIGILTNIWYRWRGKDIKAEREKRRKQLLVDGIAYAEELSAASKKEGTALTGPATLQAASQYVMDRDTDKTPLFDTAAAVEQEITAFLGRIPGVGATGDQVV